MEQFRPAYSPDLRNHSDLREAAERASATLRELVSGSPAVTLTDPVRVEWGTATDGSGRPILTLRLSEGPDDVTAVFRPDELAGEDGWFRLSRVYQALLRARTNRIMTNLAEPVASQAD